jgi:hypothetical protein
MAFGQWNLYGCVDPGALPQASGQKSCGSFLIAVKHVDWRRDGTRSVPKVLFIEFDFVPLQETSKFRLGKIALGGALVVDEHIVRRDPPDLD